MMHGGKLKLIYLTKLLDNGSHAKPSLLQEVQGSFLP
jgi:hypothetical protein